VDAFANIAILLEASGVVTALVIEQENICPPAIESRIIQ
jgi:hypothetical protein